MKLKKLLTFGILLLVITLSFVVSQENGNEEEYKYEFGDGNILKYKGDVIIYVEEEGPVVRLSKTPYLEINGQKYENIESGSIYLNNEGQIIEANFNTNEKGGEYLLGDNLVKIPRNSYVRYSLSNVDLAIKQIYPDLDVLILPSGSEIKKLQSKKEILVEGENIKFDLSGQPHTMTGTFVLFPQENKIRFKKIGGMEFDGIPVFTTSEDLDIFLDGEEHEGNENYFSIAKNKMLFQAKGLNMELTDQNPYFEISPKSQISLNVLKGKGKIQKTEKEFEITSLDENSFMDIKNNGNRVLIIEKDFFLESGYFGKPVPLKIFNPYSSEEIRTDSNGNLQIFKLRDPYAEGGLRYYRDRINHYEVPLKTEDFERMIGKKISVSGLTEKEKLIALNNLKNYWIDVHPSIRDSVEEIEIVSNVGEEYPFFKWAEKLGAGFVPEGFAAPWNKKIVLDADEISKGLVVHESTHQKHFESDEKFKEQWKSIGGPYDKTELELFPMGFKYKEKPEEKYKALYGYMDAYGGSSSIEDVATFVEVATTKPDSFKNYLSKENPWSEIYKAKLYLLHEGDFISTKNYNQILSNSGLTNQDLKMSFIKLSKK